jgi:hypothetical protein
MAPDIGGPARAEIDKIENKVPVLRPTSDILPICIRGTACRPTNIPDANLV